MNKSSAIRKLEKEVDALKRVRADLSYRLAQLDPMYATHLKFSRKMLEHAVDNLKLNTFASKRTITFNRNMGATTRIAEK